MVVYSYLSENLYFYGHLFFCSFSPFSWFFKSVPLSGRLVLVGEAKLRLDKRDRFAFKDIIYELESKASAVAGRYPGREVVKVLVSHYATGGFIKDAKKRGIMVIQSYEW